MKIFDEIVRIGVIPVIAIDSPDKAEPLADALLEGGLPLAEITFRTDAAADVIARMKDLRPEIMVGAGTVLSRRQLDAAVKAGACFALAPGFDPDVVAHAQAQGLPIAPGIMTPSEVQGCIKSGVRIMKFFPAGAAGGPKMAVSLAAPFTHLGIGFIPTGGVNQANLGEWLSLDSVKAVGGTWIATRTDIAESKWRDITAKARTACASIIEAREKNYGSV